MTQQQIKLCEETTLKPEPMASSPEPTKPIDLSVARARKSHIWVKEKDEHYVEPEWTSRRLFEVEDFQGDIHDPACGFGTIIKSALDIGHCAIGSDLVYRGFPGTEIRDFLSFNSTVDNIVTNPPFNIAEVFVSHAVELASYTVAALFPLARLNAGHWIGRLPLRRVWLLTPRPSMPPGHVIAAGKKSQGGRVDFCWLVFEKRKYQPHRPEIRWLHRDGWEI